MEEEDASLRLREDKSLLRSLWETDFLLLSEMLEADGGEAR